MCPGRSREKISITHFPSFSDCVIKCSNWQEAHQLAMYKSSRGVEPGTTRSKSAVVRAGSPDFNSVTLNIWPRCFYALLALHAKSNRKSRHPEIFGPKIGVTSFFLTLMSYLFHLISTRDPFYVHLEGHKLYEYFLHSDISHLFSHQE